VRFAKCIEAKGSRVQGFKGSRVQAQSLKLKAQSSRIQRFKEQVGKEQLAKKEKF
jgi:hypothetical protein